MRITEVYPTIATDLRVDWDAIKDKIVLADVAIHLLGSPPTRRGRKLIWLCPFHDDHRPSFEVDTSRGTWRCWTCGIGGDGPDLVMRVNKCDFPEAIRFLAGVIPGGETRPLPSRPVPGPPCKPLAGPSGLSPDQAATLVRESTERLWRDEGRPAREYLEGRGIDEETARTAGLGWTPKIWLPNAAGDGCYPFWGITIPWKGDAGRLIRVKIRLYPEVAGKHRYAEAYSDRPLVYPSSDAIGPGLPLIIAEGEFDCLLLSAHLPEASVITLGSASARTDPRVISRMLTAPRWFAALDADQAGDNASAKLPARAVRVRPSTLR